MVANQKANPNSIKTEEKISKLTALLNKKDSEISFLKDTVRVECEERMGLLATVANLQRESSQWTKSPKQTETIQSVKETKSNTLGSRPGSSSKPKSSPQIVPDVKLSSKESELYRLFQMASAKNEKRLAKQSRKLF